MQTTEKWNSVLFWNTTLFYRCFALGFLVGAGKRRERKVSCRLEYFAH